VVFLCVIVKQTAFVMIVCGVCGVCGVMAEGAALFRPTDYFWINGINGVSLD